jgi:UDP-N-acetyl-D-mannosaminuronic acid dehydrogenase
LTFKAKKVITTDPYVTSDRDLMPLAEVVDQSDVLILCVPHKQYEHLETKGKPIVDIWGFLGNGTLF